MPETTDTLKWTAPRHAMLREVASDRDYVFTASFSFDHLGGRLTRGECRVLGTLRQARLICSIPQERSYHDQPIELTESGRSLLSRWDAEHPKEAP